MQNGQIAERAVSRCLHKQGLAPEAIHNDIPIWWQHLGRMPLYVIPREVGDRTEGRALRITHVLEGLSVASPEVVTEVNVVVMGNRRDTERYIASAVEMSQEMSNFILTKIWKILNPSCIQISDS